MQLPEGRDLTTKLIEMTKDNTKVSNETDKPAFLVGAVMPSCLQLSLKTKWFEMTRIVKKEDYRSINEYWFKRLVFQHKKVFHYLSGYDWDLIDKQTREVLIERICSDKYKSKMIGFKCFDFNVMTLGYPKSTDTEKILKLEHKGIKIGTGDPEWGAEPNKLYFVIMHGGFLV